MSPNNSIIINPFTPIPKSDRSHVRGWSILWSQRIGSDIGSKDSNIFEYDKIFIDHGVNFSGSLNLFGGFNDEVFERCNDLIIAKRNGAEIIFLDQGSFSCNYEDQIRKRIGQNTSSKYLTEEFVNEFGDLLSECKTLTMSQLSLVNLIIGDSHSLAFSLPNQKVFKNNGQTLYSVLRIGLIDYIKGFCRDKFIPKEIDLCLGSIDIRHHSIRLNVDAQDFAVEYAKKVIEAQNYFQIPINVCAPVPIEYEERKLPKTGQYDGKNFSGTRKQRLDFTRTFIDTIDDYNSDFDIIIPPLSWYDMDGEKYANDIMELNSSVHIAPKNYRSILEW